QFARPSERAEAIRSARRHAPQHPSRTGLVGGGVADRGVLRGVPVPGVFYLVLRAVARLVGRSRALCAVLRARTQLPGLERRFPQRDRRRGPDPGGGALRFAVARDRATRSY